MEKLKLEMFDIVKIGSSFQLRQIKGGTTYTQTGAGTNSDGSTYKDWDKDSGSTVTGEKCGVSDSTQPQNIHSWDPIQ